MKRLLVIEDDEPIARVLEHGLRLAGYTVIVEADGHAGHARWTQAALGDDEGVRLRAAEVGIDTMIVKPFAYAELLDRVAGLTSGPEAIPGAAHRLDA